MTSRLPVSYHIPVWASCFSLIRITLNLSAASLSSWAPLPQYSSILSFWSVCSGWQVFLGSLRIRWWRFGSSPYQVHPIIRSLYFSDIPVTSQTTWSSRRILPSWSHTFPMITIASCPFPACSSIWSHGISVPGRTFALTSRILVGLSPWFSSSSARSSSKAWPLRLSISISAPFGCGSHRLSLGSPSCNFRFPY